jgi:hypothetical protein
MALRSAGGGLHGDVQVLGKVAADLGRVVQDGDAHRLQTARQARSPTSSSSCGELIAPPDRITSPPSARASTRSPQLDPVARWPSEQHAVDLRAGQHRQVRRGARTGSRKARRAENRWPSFCVT